MNWKLALLAALIAVVGGEARGADWTVYAVINGDNYSEMTDEATGETAPMAPKVFRQIEEQALKNENVDTVILYDPGEDAGVGLFRWPQPSILEFISGGRVVERVRLGETNLADPDTLAEMLEWGRELSRPNAQALLYFWSHHIPVANPTTEDNPTKTFDYSHPDSTFTAETLRKALMDGGVSFNAIIMSTCYGTTLEALIQLQDIADYYVGTASRLLYDGGLARDFISLLNSRPKKSEGTQTVLKHVYDQAIQAYLVPRPNPVAQRLVPKVNPQPAIFSLAEVQRFRTLWREFVEFTEEQYRWQTASIVERAYLVNSNGKPSQNWLDLLRYFKEWQTFLADRHSHHKDPVAISGIVQIQEMEKVLHRMILKPTFRLRISERERANREIFRAPAHDWDVSQSYSGLTVFVPHGDLKSLVRLNQPLGGKHEE